MLILACAVAISSLPGRYDLREGAPSEPFGPIRSAQVSAKRSPRGGRLAGSSSIYLRRARHSDLRSVGVCEPMVLSHGRMGRFRTDPPTKFADYYKLSAGGMSALPEKFQAVAADFQPAPFRPFWQCSSSCVFFIFVILLTKTPSPDFRGRGLSIFR